jgi:heme/copper-type cytochrome/quinol oxidase subunit 3
MIRVNTARLAHAEIAPQPNNAAAATVSVGMAIALGAVAMSFAGVLLSYAIVRAQAPLWPPPGESAPPPVWPWPAMATLAALAGSAGLRWARRAVVDASANLSHIGTASVDAAALHQRRLGHALVATALAGVLFIGVQTVAWLRLGASGIRPSSGIVASVVYALTLFHALHALVALIVLLPVLLRALRGRVISGSSLAAVSAFWHLVTVAWVVVFLAVFVA